MTNEQLVSKVWNYAHVLRDQGVSYGDYIEQITYLLFLKMDQEREELLGEKSSIPPAMGEYQHFNGTYNGAPIDNSSHHRDDGEREHWRTTSKATMQPRVEVGQGETEVTIHHG